MNDYHYAVVVGINRYPGINDLSGPMNDADAFYRWLIDPTGGALPEPNARLVEATGSGAVLASPYDALPQRHHIDQAVDQVVTAASGDIDGDPDRWDRSRLYLFFAGHGIAPHGSKGALLAANARPGAYGFNFDVRLHVDWLEACGHFREVVVFVDCCRNRVNNASRGGPVFDHCPSTPGEVQSLVGYATALDRLAYEETADVAEVSPDELRGYFSAALMEALTGGSGAADPLTGEVTAASLSGWVRQRVAELTAHRNAPQMVDIKAPATPLVLRRGVARAKHEVRLHFPAGHTDRVTLLGHSLQALDSWDPAQGPWTVSLDDGLYQVIVDGTDDGAPFADRGRFRVRGEGFDVKL
jgi:Caspase domain